MLARTGLARTHLSERVLSFVLLLLASGGVLPLFYSPDVDGFSSPAAQVCFGVLYTIIIGLLLVRWSKAIRVAKQTPFVWILVLYASLSTAWSSAPDVTARRVAMLIGTTVAALYLSIIYDRHQLLAATGWVFASSAVLTVLVVVVWPDLGLHADVRGMMWKGIFAHKNALGLAMALAVGVWLCIIPSVRGIRRLVTLGALVLSAALVALSGSATGMVAAATIVALWVTRPLIRAHHSLVIPSLVLLVGGVVAAFIATAGDSDALLHVLGRQSDLTGRTELWSLAWQEMIRTPLLGHGYGAFWLDWDGPSAAIWTALKWRAPYAHNGYLDLLLELGIVGLVLVLPLVLRALVGALKTLRTSSSGDSFFPLVIVVVMLTVNMSESSILTRNNIFWLLFTSILFRRGADLEGSEMMRRPIRTPHTAALSWRVRRRMRHRSSAMHGHVPANMVE